MSGTGTLDIDASATVTTLTPTNNVTLDVAAGLTLTITNAVTVPTTKIVTFTGTNDASAETLTLTGGMTLTGPSGVLNVIGDNTAARRVNVLCRPKTDKAQDDGSDNR